VGPCFSLRTLAIGDAEFAKVTSFCDARIGICIERTVPAYEWNFGDEPPVHGWAAFRVFRDRQQRGLNPEDPGDLVFLSAYFKAVAELQ
jgi:hypothetical protein